jgi:hypothetical protein
MSKPNTGKSKHKGDKDEVAQVTRERELRDLIERVETEKSGSVRPLKESPHDFVERRMREKFKK